MGGMGRTQSGSYAEWVAVPAANVVPVRTTLNGVDLAALPASQAAAWSCRHDSLPVIRGDTVFIRGETSAWGWTAIGLAKRAGAKVIATVRWAERMAVATEYGADEVLLENGDIEEALRGIEPRGADRVLDLIGYGTLKRDLPRYSRNYCMRHFILECEHLVPFEERSDQRMSLGFNARSDSRVRAWAETR